MVCGGVEHPTSTDRWLNPLGHVWAIRVFSPSLNNVLLTSSLLLPFLPRNKGKLVKMQIRQATVAIMGTGST